MNKNRLFNRRKEYTIPERFMRKRMKSLNASLRKLGFNFLTPTINEEYD